MPEQVKSRPLSLCRVSSEELIAALLEQPDNKPDYNTLIKSMDKQIKFWAEQLKNPLSKFYQQILHLVHHDNRQEKLDFWLMLNQHSLIEELTFTWYKTLLYASRRYTKRYIPALAINIEKYLAVYFRFNLSTLIDIAFYKTPTIEYDLEYEPHYPDYFLIKNLELNTFEKYILLKQYEDYSNTEIANLLHTVDMNILRHTRAICKTLSLIEKKTSTAQ